MTRLAVVVPSHDRPLRLRWLLEALREQTLDPSQWEVVVAHDSRGPETEAVLRDCGLPNLHVLRYMPGDAGPAAKRNAAWRATRAPHVVFTDDDCRPPRDWLANALAAVARHPEAIVQGTTVPDPDELVVKLHSPHARTQEVHPPHPSAQTCNVVYPRAVLEACGGFDEKLPVAAGEDTDLALRAQAAGTPLVAAPEVLTYHCVEPASLLGRLRESWRWQHLAYLVKVHPEVRASFAGPGGLFWKPQHVRALWLLGALGALLARRPWLAGLLVLPWAVPSAPSYGRGPRGRLRALSELPGHAAIDLVEVAALARGSVRHRSLLL